MKFLKIIVSLLFLINLSTGILAYKTYSSFKNYVARKEVYNDKAIDELKILKSKLKHEKRTSEELIDLTIKSHGIQKNYNNKMQLAPPAFLLWSLLSFINIVGCVVIWMITKNKKYNEKSVNRGDNEELNVQANQ